MIVTSPSRRGMGGQRGAGGSAESQPLLSAHNRSSSYEDIDSALDSDDNIFTGKKCNLNIGYFVFITYIKQNVTHL